MAPRFNRQQKRVLRAASREIVQKAFERLRRYFRRSRWVGDNNRYRRNCIEHLWEDTQIGKSVNQAHLSQYIAASALLHCVDGWSLLGRSIQCHAHGDGDSARHLGYYAELRAAMSVLAVEGRGIFDDRHFVTDASGICRSIGVPNDPRRRGTMGTHKVAWLTLEHWAGLKRSADLLAEIIRPNGIALREWLEAFSPGNLWWPIGSEWLKTWGLDLRRLVDDREARNISSYRPTRLISAAFADVTTSSAFLCSLWQLFEPSSQSRFELTDRQLVRLSLETGYKAVTGQTPKGNPSDFEKRIASMLQRLGIEGQYEQEWKSFLSRATGRLDDNDSIILTTSRQKATVEHPHHHMHVIARAALLLRVATGACARLLRETGVSRGDLEFWWKPLGMDRGLWGPGDEPTDMVDLWADAEAAIEVLSQWEQQVVVGNEPASYAGWRRGERADAVSVLGGCERIGLWGLGL